MRSKIVLLFALIGFVAKSESLAWDHISLAGRSTMLRVLKDPDCPKQLYSCLDCNTARICRPTGPQTWSEVTRVPCPTTAPYCDKFTGSCTTKPDKTCGQGDAFICPNDSGHFPDPVDCTLYHVCDNYMATQFKCADGLKYNAINEDCEANSTCPTALQCKEEGTKVAFPGRERYFAYCYGGKPSIIDRCVGDYELNVTSQECEAVCKDEGILRDNDDCTKFFFCHKLYYSKDFQVMLKDSLTCPTGQGFDPDLRMCRPIADVKGCVPPAPTAEPTYPTTEGTTTTTPTPPTTVSTPPPTTTAAP